jgi:hypothetical protein
MCYALTRIGNQQQIYNFRLTKLNEWRREGSRHFGNKKKAYLKAKFEEIEINSKIKYAGDLYRGIIEFRRG